jgi:hypothetical protein
VLLRSVGLQDADRLIATLTGSRMPLRKAEAAKIITALGSAVRPKHRLCGGFRWRP